MTSLPDETAPGAADRSDPVALLATRARGALCDAPAPGGSGCAPVAAVRCGDGSIHLGRSFRSRTEGLGACALRVALTRAIAEGHPPATHALLAWPAATGSASAGSADASPGREARSDDPVGRCGLGPCIQTLLALAPGATLFRIEGDAAPEPISVSAALPGPFASFEPEGGR